jgi:Fic family protein
MLRSTGTYEKSTVTGEEVASFVPAPLPPVDPPLLVSNELRELVRDAEHHLARLELAGAMVPSPHWFIYAFVRKEAVVSSQIEGTQATLVDLLAFEETDTAETSSPDDLEEICNYLDALAYARKELRRDGGLPMSMRLLNETHRRLLKGMRGKHKNAVYVPPPPHLLNGILADFEKYLHAGSDLHPLVRAGLLHAQFETIHPYLDGNGRVGRLLVTLLLEDWKLLSEPLLYLSLFFKRHRAEYYRLLGAIRTVGDWERWTVFFLEGISTIAREAVVTARELFALVSEDRARVLAAPTSSVMAARLMELLPRHPVVTVGGVTRHLQTTKPTAGKAISTLVDVGVLVETTGRKRDRTFHYREYLENLRVGTELE